MTKILQDKDFSKVQRVLKEVLKRCSYLFNLQELDEAFTKILEKVLCRNLQDLGGSLRISLAQYLHNPARTLKIFGD